MNILLWVFQVFLAFQFGMGGVLHFTLPPDLPPTFAWIYDLSPGMHLFTGTVEIAAALGLILPGLTKIQTRLTPLAAAGIVPLMIGAIAFHIPRGETQNAVMNLFALLVAAFVAYMRFKKLPLAQK